jgi:inward rectifier potassium channel
MLIILSFISVLICFATIYAIGIEHLDGITSTDSELVKFGQVYFF